MEGASGPREGNDAEGEDGDLLLHSVHYNGSPRARGEGDRGTATDQRCGFEHGEFLRNFSDKVGIFCVDWVRGTVCKWVGVKLSAQASRFVSKVTVREIAKCVSSPHLGIDPMRCLMI